MMHAPTLSIETACHFIPPKIASFVADYGINDVLLDIALSSSSVSTLKYRMHGEVADKTPLENKLMRKNQLKTHKAVRLHL